MSPQIRLIVADDHVVIRKGFLYIFKVHSDLDLVGEAKTGLEAVHLCENLMPDVVLMDVVMPEMDGIEATQIITEKHKQIQVILLTSFENEPAIVQRGLEAGALSFLYKDVGADELVRVIREANEKRAYLAPRATRNLIQSKTQMDADDFHLSAREMDVLPLLVKGLTNNEIAEQLTISPATVKFHVSSLLGKLHASTRTEVVSIAIKNGLIEN